MSDEIMIPIYGHLTADPEIRYTAGRLPAETYQ